MRVIGRLTAEVVRFLDGEGWAECEKGRCSAPRFGAGATAGRCSKLERRSHYVEIRFDAREDEASWVRSEWTPAPFPDSYVGAVTRTRSA